MREMWSFTQSVFRIKVDSKTDNFIDLVSANGKLSAISCYIFKSLGFKFKQVGEDKNGYPINEHVNGEPVLDKVIRYEVPYLKDEVISLINWLKLKN